MNFNLKKIFFAIQQHLRHLSYSTKLIVIVSLHIVIIGVNGYTTYYVINITRMDAKMINDGGIIRGSIQKVIKLESNNIQDTQDINHIDALLQHFLKTDKGIIRKNHLTAFLKQLHIVNKQWNALKVTIFQYRLNHDPQIKKRMIAQSEACWEAADKSVALAQLLSEIKLHLFYFLYLLFFLDLLLVLVIIWLINLIVRHNLEQNAYNDALTGIGNRRSFEENLQQEITRSTHQGTALSLIIFDIDHFKIINDTYGHDTGDVVLRNLALLVKSHIRNSDLFCRIGGEEFAIILPNTPLKPSLLLAEKIRVAVSQHLFKKVQHLTISLGVAQFEADMQKDQLYKKADTALYQAKIQGRNLVRPLA